MRRGRGRTRDDRQSQTPKWVRVLTSRILRQFLATSGGAVRATKEWPPVNEERRSATSNEGANGARFFCSRSRRIFKNRSVSTGRTDNSPCQIFFPQTVRSWTLRGQEGTIPFFILNPRRNGFACIFCVWVLSDDRFEFPFGAVVRHAPSITNWLTVFCQLIRGNCALTNPLAT